MNSSDKIKVIQWYTTAAREGTSDVTETNTSRFEEIGLNIYFKNWTRDYDEKQVNCGFNKEVKTSGHIFSLLLFPLRKKIVSYCASFFQFSGSRSQRYSIISHFFSTKEINVTTFCLVTDFLLLSFLSLSPFFFVLITHTYTHTHTRHLNTLSTLLVQYCLCYVYFLLYC